jgi:hypothetical protein
MSGTHATVAVDDTIAGKVILVVTSSLAALLVIAGLIYATGTGARHQAGLTAAGCEPGLSPSGLQCTTAQMLTSQYMAILTPASQQVNTDMAAYVSDEKRHLDAAEAALTAEATSERAFDTNLAGVQLPPSIAPVAQTLIQNDQALANLVAEQARSRSLTQLRSFNHRVQLANAAVQKEMKLLLKDIEAPPPAS